MGRPYFSAIRKSLLYLTIPFFLASCTAEDIRSEQKPSFIERVVKKISDAPAPDIDRYPRDFNIMVQRISQKELNRPERYSEIYALREIESSSYCMEEDSPDYRLGMKFKRNIYEKAFKESAEDMAKDYFSGSRAESTLKRMSEISPEQGVDISFKPGLYHGEPYLNALFEIDAMNLLSLHLGRLKTEVGTRGYKIKLEKDFDLLRFSSSYEVDEKGEELLFRLSNYKFRGKTFSGFVFTAGKGDSKSSLEEELSNKGWIYSLGYLMKF